MEERGRVRTVRRFDGRSAVVTGGGSGIGEATAHRLAAEGAVVMVADVDGANAVAVAKMIGEKGGRAIARAVDVTSRAEIDAAIQQILSECGRLDVMVNNAGIAPMAPLDALDEAFIARSNAVNVNGVIFGTAAAGAVMLESGGGSIVNIASVSAIAGSVPSVVYSATKGAVVSLTRSAACELAPAVRVNSVAPGSVRTPIHNKVFNGPPSEEIWRAIDKMHLLGRAAEPGEIAAAIAFLASDDASFVTGTTLVVDGGMTAQLPPIVMPTSSA